MDKEGKVEDMEFYKKGEKVDKEESTDDKIKKELDKDYDNQRT